MTYHQILAEAQQLSPEERAELGWKMFESTDDDPEEVAEGLANLLARRIADYDAGRTKAIPADEFLAELEREFP